MNLDDEMHRGVRLCCVRAAEYRSCNCFLSPGLPMSVWGFAMTMKRWPELFPDPSPKCMWGGPDTDACRWFHYGSCDRG